MIAPVEALDNMRCVLSRINNTVSRYETLVVLVGTSTDSVKLQTYLNAIRDQMVDDVKKSRDTFIEYCKAFLIENVSKEQRDLFERLYAFYLTSIEYFRQQISRNCSLSHDFVDEEPNGRVIENPICTGTIDIPSIVSSQYSTKSLKSSRKSSCDNNITNATTGNMTLKKAQLKGNSNADDLRRLEKDFLELGLILHDLHSSVHLSHWNIVPVIKKKDPDNQSTYSSDDDLDPETKRKSVDGSRKSSSLKRPRSNSKHSSEIIRPSVQIGSTQYYTQPRLLLKASYWNKRRKIRLIVALIIAFGAIAIIVTVLCVLLLRK